MNTLSLKAIQATISIVTGMVQATMWIAILYCVFLLCTALIADNLKINRVQCNTYLTDSTHAWLEVSNMKGDRLITVTYDCMNDSIVSVK